MSDIAKQRQQIDEQMDKLERGSPEWEALWDKSIALQNKQLSDEPAPKADPKPYDPHAWRKQYDQPEQEPTPDPSPAGEGDPDAELRHLEDAARDKKKGEEGTGPAQEKLPGLPAFQSTFDKEKVQKLINDNDAIRKEDRDFFAAQYDKLMAANKENTNQLQFRKLLGMFMDSMSNYAAAAYGDKHNIDMKGVNPKIDWDWKSQQAAIDKQLSAGIDKLKTETSQKRQDTQRKFSQDMMLIDMAQREAANAQRWGMQAAMEERRATRADNRERRQTHQANARELRSMQRQANQDARSSVGVYYREQSKKDRALKDLVDKLEDSEKWKDEEEAISTLLLGYESAGYITPEESSAMLQKAGNWVTSGELEETAEKLRNRKIAYVKQGQTMYDNIYKKVLKADDISTDSDLADIFQDEIERFPGYRPSKSEIRAKVIQLQRGY
jgi:hypothetical protein